MLLRGRLSGLLGMAGLLAAAAVPAGRARAQTPAPGEVYVGDDDQCEVEDTITFDAGSTAVNLAAQAKLNAALQWVSEAPGRRLVLLGADGPRPEDVRLGAVRANAAAMFLIAGGANPQVITRRDFREMGRGRAYGRTDVDSVVVMTCDVAEPVP